MRGAAWRRAGTVGVSLVASSTNPDGNTTRYEYDGSRRLTKVTTARGVAVQFGYDSAGRVTSVSRFTKLGGGGDKQTTTFAYPNATTTTQTDPRGKTWTYTRDAAGRVTSVKDPLGRSRSQTWTANSSVATASDATAAGGVGGNITKYTYDSQNNPTQVQMPTGALTSAVYTTGGACSGAGGTPDQAKCITDDANNQTTMNYDAMGNLLSQADTTGGSKTGAKVSFTYQRAASATSGPDCGGKAGQRCTATDANGNVTSYAYDKDGNLAKITPPAPLKARTYEYDSLGRVIASTNGRGQRVTYEYDAQDRLLSTTVPAAAGVPARTIKKSYDEDGNEAFNDAVIAYDAQNRQEFVKDSNGEGYTASYDAAGNMTSVSGNGETYRYTYDAANQLTTAALSGVTCAENTTPQDGCVKFSYDKNGRELQRWLPNATVVTTVRDGSGRPTRIYAANGAQVRYDVSYSYTKPGSADAKSGDRRNVQTRTDTVGVNGSINNGSVTTYGYDSQSRLTSAVEKTAKGAVNASWTYGYDKAGNRTSQNRAGSVQAPTGAVAYGYNAASQLVGINGASAGLSYDADGNELSNPGDDGVDVAKRSSTVSPIGDVLHMSTSRKGVQGEYDYGYGGTNPGQYLMTWSHGQAVSHSLTGIAAYGDGSGGALKVLRAPNGQALAVQHSGEVGYYVSDRLGSVLGLLNGKGQLIVSYGYDPYGNVRSAPGTSAVLATRNPFMFAGALRDAQTGLYRMGVRWYDPNLGRFTTPDPTAQEKNPYLYAAGNPCNATDSSGGASIKGFGCNMAVALMGADAGLGIWAASEAGLIAGGLPGAFIGAGAGIAIAAAGYFICDGL